MSSYLGSDTMLGGGKSKKGKGFVNFLKKSPIVSAAKFVIHPVRETKAAIKTIARFDPTAKTAKYGNITKGVLAATALGAAAVLTGGGALAVGMGMASAAATGGKMAMKPVRKPPKTIANASTPSAPALNTFTEGSEQSAFPMTTPPPMSSNPANEAIAETYTTGAKPKSNLLVIGLVGAAALALVFMQSKKGSYTPSTVTI